MTFGFPWASRHSTLTLRARGTRATRLGKLRQPSKNSTSGSDSNVSTGLMMTSKATGLRSRSASISRVKSFIYSSRSSMTASCKGRPICGAARPTPGASRMVSRMEAISSWVLGSRISSGRRGLARSRRTGSPVDLILRIIFSPKPARHWRSDPGLQIRPPGIGAKPPPQSWPNCRWRAQLSGTRSAVLASWPPL